MSRIWLLALVFLMACGNKNSKAGEEERIAAPFQQHFSEQKAPYELADTVLIHARDTTTIDKDIMAGLVPDSLIRPVFGDASIKWHPVRQITGAKESYYIVRANAGKKQAAYLLAFKNEKQRPAVTTFLIPDEDDGTSQVSTIDKSFAVTMGTNLLEAKPGRADSKSVYSYDASGNRFLLIMMDRGKSPVEIINPIDTLPAKNALAGDYVKDKKNFVSIRDGRNSSQLSFFIHFETEAGCQGELRGDLLLTTASSGIFRTGGDPCVLSMSFKNNTVTVHEDEGCGSHRGLDCLFEGKYPKKKQAASPKQNTKKAKK